MRFPHEAYAEMVALEKKSVRPQHVAKSVAAEEQDNESAIEDDVKNEPEEAEEDEEDSAEEDV